MQFKLNSRLATLEKAMWKPPAPTVTGQSPALLLAARFGAKGFVPGPDESLAEMIARAMGISVRELRVEFRRRAGYS